MKFIFSPPNQLTFLRILLTPVFLVLLFSTNPDLRHFSLAVFFVALLTDWYDGWVARRWGYVTRWGAFFDPFADKIITSAALIAFIYLGLVPAWTVWLIILRDVVITFLRTYAEYKGRPVTTSRFAKTKTFLQFVVINYLLLLFLAQDMEYFRTHHGMIIDMLLNHSVVYSMMVLIALITVWTGVLYVIENWKTIRELYDFSSRVTESR